MALRGFIRGFRFGLFRLLPPAFVTRGREGTVKSFLQRQVIASAVGCPVTAKYAGLGPSGDRGHSRH